MENKVEVSDLRHDVKRGMCALLAGLKILDPAKEKSSLDLKDIRDEMLLQCEKTLSQVEELFDKYEFVEKEGLK